MRTNRDFTLFWSGQSMSVFGPAVSWVLGSGLSKAGRESALSA